MTGQGRTNNRREEKKTEEKRKTDKAKEGMNVVVFRIISRNAKDAPGEEYSTNFRPWPDVFLRGTGPKATPSTP